MQYHIQTLVKHLFDKDSFEQVTVQELKQFTEAYPYAAVGQFLYAKKLYDARSWNYYEQTEQANLYFHNPLWFRWLMDQKYEAPLLQRQDSAQPAWRTVVQMPKGGNGAATTSQPQEPAIESKAANAESKLHEFVPGIDAEEPIQAATEELGFVQAPGTNTEQYTEEVTDNTGTEPKPLESSTDIETKLHEFVPEIDTAEPIQAATEELGFVQAPGTDNEQYTEEVTDNTSGEPQPLDTPVYTEEHEHKQDTGAIETIADIPAAKEEIETTPEFFAEAAEAEKLTSAVAIAENSALTEEQTLEQTLAAAAARITQEASELETASHAAEATGTTTELPETPGAIEAAGTTAELPEAPGIIEAAEATGATTALPEATGAIEAAEAAGTTAELPEAPGEIEAAEASASQPTSTETPSDLEALTAEAPQTPAAFGASSTRETETPAEFDASIPQQTSESQYISASTETPAEFETSAAQQTETPAEFEASVPQQTSESQYISASTETPADLEASAAQQAETPAEFEASIPQQTSESQYISASTETPAEFEASAAQQTETPAEFDASVPQQTSESQYASTESPAELEASSAQQTSGTESPAESNSWTTQELSTTTDAPAAYDQPVVTSDTETPQTQEATNTTPETNEIPATPAAFDITEAVYGPTTRETPAETGHAEAITETLADIHMQASGFPTQPEQKTEAAPNEPEVQAPKEPAFNIPVTQEPPGQQWKAEPVFTQASKEPKTTIDTEEPIFESYHTIDYFASQGIKLQQEDYKDRLGKQLKSFTEWLRSMKRIVPTEANASLDEVTNQSIVRIAEHSVEEKEVITEAMAEVWAKQGHREKAISVYEKLSLLNPAKSPYFAGRIEQLKAL